MNASANFDLLVIGGGIAGVGVALEAAGRGISTALLEKGELLGATSNNSLRIIHSGFRYLQDLSLERVLESTSAQIELQEMAPEYFRKLLCYMPLERWGLKSRAPLWCAGKLYSLYRRALCSQSWQSGILTQSCLANEFPFLAEVAPHGAFYWEDLLIEDQSGWHLFLRDLLVTRGVKLYEKCCATQVEKKGEAWSVAAQSNGVSKQFSARAVVNSIGPGAKKLTPRSLNLVSSVSWCKAVNLVVSRQFDAERAIALTSPQGRLFFVVPRSGSSVIGTFYVKLPDGEVEASLSLQERARFLNEFNQCLPGRDLSESDIISCDLGVLPCRSSNAPEPQLLYQPRLLARENYLEMVAIKYTTFLVQARKICDLVRL